MPIASSSTPSWPLFSIGGPTVPAARNLPHAPVPQAEPPGPSDALPGESLEQVDGHRARWSLGSGVSRTRSVSSSRYGWGQASGQVVTSRRLLAESILDESPWSGADRERVSPYLVRERKWFPNNLVTIWKQGDPGNCASVAVIKAAMATYGNRMFEEVRPNEQGGYDVVMRDGFRMTLGQDEMDVAKRLSGFLGAPTPELAFARLAYAAEARRNQSQRDGMSYEASCREINEGMFGSSAAALLGLDPDLHPSNGPEDPRSPASFGDMVTHAVVSIRVGDHYEADFFGEAGPPPEGFRHWNRLAPDGPASNGTPRGQRSARTLS